MDSQTQRLEMNEADIQTAARLVSDLVRVPTVNPPGNEAACTDFIEAYLRDAGIPSRRVARPFADRPQLLAMLGSGSGPVLALNGHMDVVPEGDLSEWTHAPFSGDIVGHTVYGRGTVDMKGGLAAMMLAARALIGESASWKGTLVLQFAIGEETGEAGTLELLKEEPRPDWGIVLEPTDLQVGVAERGVSWWEFTAHGKGAHAGTPAEGISAIDMALRLAANIAAYQEELTHRTKHPLLGGPSCMITMIGGGTKENVVPDECRVLVDRRMVPGESQASVEPEVGSLWPDDIAARGETRCTRLFEPAEISVDEAIVSELGASMRRVTGQDADICSLPAGTDARNFINDAGVPAVIWGPGEGITGCHVADEAIEADQIALAAEVLVDLCRTLLR
jgi:succinyl-diaminopimelate desuccinylase